MVFPWFSHGFPRSNRLCPGDSRPAAAAPSWSSAPAAPAARSWRRGIRRAPPNGRSPRRGPGAAGALRWSFHGVFMEENIFCAHVFFSRVFLQVTILWGLYGDFIGIYMGLICDWEVTRGSWWWFETQRKIYGDLLYGIWKWFMMAKGQCCNSEISTILECWKPA